MSGRHSPSISRRHAALAQLVPGLVVPSGLRETLGPLQVATIVTAAASETTGIATSQTTAVASTVNPIAGQVATALANQNSVYNFHQGVFQFELTIGTCGWLLPVLSL